MKRKNKASEYTYRGKRLKGGGPKHAAGAIQSFCSIVCTEDMPPKKGLMISENNSPTSDDFAC